MFSDCLEAVRLYETMAVQLYETPHCVTALTPWSANAWHGAPTRCPVPPWTTRSLLARVAALAVRRAGGIVSSVQPHLSPTGLSAS